MNLIKGVHLLVEYNSAGYALVLLFTSWTWTSDKCQCEGQMVACRCFSLPSDQTKITNFDNARVTKGRLPQLSPWTLRHTIRTQTSYGQGYLGQASAVGISVSCPLILPWSRIPSYDATDCFLG